MRVRGSTFVRGVAVAASLAATQTASVASAEDIGPSAPRVDESGLARETQNPLSGLASIPVQDQADFGVGPNDRVLHTLSIAPTFGFSVGRRAAIVSRTKLPLVVRPEVTAGGRHAFGLGDAMESLFFVPGPVSGFLWGFGPSFLFPTATPRELGADKLALGPTAAVLTQPKPWTFGAIVGQLWSLAGSSDRPDVNLLALNYFVTLQFPRGWYVRTAPTITANRNAEAPDQWTVPVGGGAGKVVEFGELPVDVSFAGYWNAIRPRTLPSPQMTAQLQVSLLLSR